MKDIMSENRSAEERVRLEKSEQMRMAGIDPWASFRLVTATTRDVLTTYQEDGMATPHALAGRIISVRLHGKTAFLHLQDRTGVLQLYIKKDVIGAEQFDWFTAFVDVGDIIWVHGTPFKTKTGEITLNVDQLVLLSKCLRPLPEKFHGLADIEIMYRQRYLDLISNKESRERFKTRSLIVKTMREFLEAHDFMEVETPMLHPIPGGAVARPFMTHHNALSSDFYLRVAPELYLKRLVVGGFERVFEINRTFRNEGISTKHNPEFTMAEWYMAHQNYEFMMDFVEQLLRKIVQRVCGALSVIYGEYELDFDRPFRRISLKDAVLEYGKLSKNDLAEETIESTMKRFGVTVPTTKSSLGEKLYALFEEIVEDQLIQPTFITHFPIEVSPLSRRDEKDPTVAARFELFIAGMELSNGFNELNDPFEQAERFKAQVDARDAGDDEAHHYDADYILALEYALPPTVGVGMGIDRLTMLLTNTSSIKDVILFPTLKKKQI